MTGSPTRPTLTAFTVENFKGVGPPVRLELRPLTLLFGHNSAGKSSLLHALMYAREVFERHNLDADRTLTAGPALDLGGFRTFAHNHATDPDKPIRLRVELDLGATDLVGEFAPRVRQQADYELAHFSERLRTAAVEVVVGWASEDGSPFVREYAVTLDGRPAGRMLCDGRNRGVRLVGLTAADASEFQAVLAEHQTAAGAVLQPVGESGAIGIVGQADALPELRMTASGLSAALAVANMPVSPGEEVAVEVLRAAVQALVVGPGRLVRDLLAGLRYLGPQRVPPPRDFRPPRRPDPARWAVGLGGWDALFGNHRLRDRVSDWLEDEGRGDLGYRLDRVDGYELPADSPLLTAARAGTLDGDEVSRLLAGLPRRPRLVFRPTAAPAVTLEPADVGVGVSQMLPVVAAAWDDQLYGPAALPASLVAVEHPELNLHPRLQGELADVLLEGAVAEATRGRVVLAETHSEVFTLRVLKRVGQGRLPGGAAVTALDVGVFYVERSGGGVGVREVRVDDRGKLIDPWPDDDTLFEQDHMERYG